MFLFFFFFSSRRRHTRSLRDWSSDVCSSDLLGTRCAGTASPVTLTAEMARPLGARQLIDGSTGLALLVLDESAVARVTYAPAGYRPGGACRPPSAVGGSRPTVPESTTVLAPARPGGRLSPVSVTQIFGSRPTQRAGPVW